MSLKDFARKIYQAIPDGNFRRRAAAMAYRKMYGAALAKCYVENGIFHVQAKDGILVRTVKDFDPASLVADFVDVDIPEGAVVFDIGANIGAVTIYMATKVGKTGKVIAYEPDTANVEMCHRNFAANGSPKNIELVPKGIFDRDGTLEFFSGGNYTSSLLKTNYIEGESEKYHVTKVPVTTLDLEVERLGLNRLDFIKMDIEGSEAAALRAARKTLERFHPPIIVETHVVDGKSTAADVEETLRAYGYKKFVKQDLAETPAIRASF
jgi:FkbM family methyltransferase